MQIIKESIKVIIIGFVLIAGVSLVSAWTGPPGNPPDPNAPAPINVSNVAQQKTGALRVGGLTSDYNSYLAAISGKVGIKTTSPDSRSDVALDVGGNIITGVKTPVDNDDAVNLGYLSTLPGSGPEGWICTTRVNTANIAQGQIVTAQCQGNEKVINGGCTFGTSMSILGRPATGVHGWSCYVTSGIAPSSATAYAYCCL